MGGGSVLQGLIDIAFYAVVALALSIAGFFVMGVITTRAPAATSRRCSRVLPECATR